MNIKGQGHSLTLVQVHSDSTFSNSFFSLEAAGPPCTYMVKTIKNLLVWNQKVDNLETWYLVSAKRLPYLFKWWHWYDLDLFYGKVIFVPLCFLWEEYKNNIFVYNIKVGRCSQSNEYMKHYEYQRSTSFIDLHPRSLRFNIFKLFFLRNP